MNEEQSRVAGTSLEPATTGALEEVYEAPARKQCCGCVGVGVQWIKLTMDAMGVLLLLVVLGELILTAKSQCLDCNESGVSGLIVI